MSENLLLSARGVNKSFGATRALIDVDVDISLGEIRGDGEHLTCHTYLDGVTRDVPIPEHVAGDRHGGGDYNLLEAFVNAILTGDRSCVVSGMAESFDTHMLTFAAERSRLTGTVVAPDGM